MATSLLLLVAAGARAQDPDASGEGSAPPDSTQAGAPSPTSPQPTTAPGGLQGAGQRSAESPVGTAVGTAVDSLGMGAPGFQWFGPFHPVATFKLGASVQSVDLSGAVDLPWELLDGFSTRSSYQRGVSDFRQRDRQSQSERTNTAWERRFRNAMKFSMRFDRSFSHDEERVSGRSFVVESTDQNGEARLGGGGVVARGLTQAWGVRGRIQDAQSSNRGTDNNRALRFGGASGTLAYDIGDWSARAALGGDRARGDRQLRGKTAPARTATDTLGTKVTYQGPARLNLDFDVRRILFEERRLDFPKDALGRVDTLSTADSLKVQNEKEERATDELSFHTGTQLLPGVAVDAAYSYDFTETTFKLNQQGLLRRASEALDLSASLQHADASSLMVAYATQRDWTDQRPIGKSFRGREIIQSKQASLTLQQALFGTTSLRAVASQELKQFIYDYSGNPNDRDELYERVDATLTTQALPQVTATVRGTLNLVRTINIDEALVPNNQQSRTYDVGTGYTWTGIPRVSLHQDYTLSIVFRNLFASDDKDEFNKQGTLSSDATLMLPGNATLSVRHLRDFRKNGRRNVATRTAYNTTQRREDNQITVGVTMPIAGFTVKAETRRGRLQDESPLVANPAQRLREESSGDLRTGISGKREFFRQRLAVDLKLERVAAYGPRVRAEEKDYLVANTTLTWRF